jgi:hypothetical protein
MHKDDAVAALAVADQIVAVATLVAVTRFGRNILHSLIILHIKSFSQRADLRRRQCLLRPKE